jgi:hypothetical protein
MKEIKLGVIGTGHISKHDLEIMKEKDKVIHITGNKGLSHKSLDIIKNEDLDNKDNNKLNMKVLKNRQTSNESLVIRIAYNSIFGIDTLERLPLEISGYVNDWKIDKDGNKLINSFDIKSVDYIYHNPFTNKENINIENIK